ncbi:hypothetical protein [Microbacterium sp.]|uniref:hypothetical protein n=1 Tax=Microbacterium sp. TaxID=51671 RepID=UPI003C77FE30
MSAAACRVDRSPDTGSLVVCTCGFALGPFMDHSKALDVAEEHRRIHAAPVKLTAEAKARHLETQRRYRAEKKARRAQ